jgi:hypothetical protein
MINLLKLLLQLIAIGVGGLLMVGGGICTLIDAGDLILNGTHPAGRGDLAFHFGGMLGWALAASVVGFVLVGLGMRFLKKRSGG